MCALLVDWIVCASDKDDCVEKIQRVEDGKTELIGRVADLQRELAEKQCELNAEKEANSRAPSQTIKNHVERLKNQLALKEKQQQVCLIGFCHCCPKCHKAGRPV